MNINKKVLVTGGAGFIGSELTRQLVELGAFVIVVDNLVNGKKTNLDGLPPDRVKLEICDIRNRVRMAELMSTVNIVFHLAALGVRHSIHSPVENHEVNATGTLGLLIEAHDAGVNRFLCVSTSEVYGTGYKIPMDEEHPTYPMTVYGASKLAGECYTRAFYRSYGYPTVVIRPFNTFGPRSHHEGDSGEVIPKMILTMLLERQLTSVVVWRLR
jgi:UDP-glucose 4-epimerase